MGEVESQRRGDIPVLARVEHPSRARMPSEGKVWVSSLSQREVSGFPGKSKFSETYKPCCVSYASTVRLTGAKPTCYTIAEIFTTWVLQTRSLTEAGIARRVLAFFSRVIPSPVL